MIRWTPAANTFELLYRNGATTPTQTDPTWELPIAQMSGGSMTDLREFVTRGTVTTRMIDPEAVTYTKLAGDVVTRFIETDGHITNTDTALTASFQAVVTSTFTKPPSWNTYEITVWGSAMLNATLAGPCVVRASAGFGNHGTERNAIAGDAADMKTDVAVRARFTGLTGDTQECSIDAKKNSGTVDVESAIISWQAIRTT